MGELESITQGVTTGPSFVQDVIESLSYMICNGQLVILLKAKGVLAWATGSHGEGVNRGQKL